MKQMNLQVGVLILSLLINAIHSQTDNQQIDKQTQYIQQFARTMSDFVPTQTFTFTIEIGQQQNFLLWPTADIDKIRGVFYIDHSEDAEATTGEGFFVGCEINQQMKKTFVNQRLGVFNFNLQTHPINMKFIFKSDNKPLKIYLSYELKKSIKKEEPQNKDQNVLTKQEEQLKQKQSKLKQVSDKFENVRISVEGQENSLRTILKMIGKHGRRIENEVKYAHYRIIIETAVVIISGIFGIWIIKRQMSSGYQLLV